MDIPRSHSPTLVCEFLESGLSVSLCHASVKSTCFPL